MKQYQIQYRFNDGALQDWFGVDRAAGVDVGYTFELNRAREMFANVIQAAKKNGVDPSRYRLVCREVSPWEVVEGGAA